MKTLPVPPDQTRPPKTSAQSPVRGGQPTSLPTRIPTTVESITRAQIERSVNAADSEDALKYFPSTLDNSDVNGFTYQGVSKFSAVDLRVHWH